MDLAQLARLQRGPAEHLTFSLTLHCPLHCSHCIVRAGPHRANTTMPLATAEWYASQMPSLASHGIREISLTGGEPFFACDQVRMLTEAAASARIECGVVTSGFWARSPAAARDFVARFPGIGLWDLSADRYHLREVPIEQLRFAYEALQKAGVRALIRVAYLDASSSRDTEIIRAVRAFAEDEHILCQQVRFMGRAARMRGTSRQPYDPLARPCMTQGCVIRYDGSIAPCCVSLVEEREHPFQLGDATKRRLTEVHDDYMCHPLLQLIRVLGFGEIMRWISDAGMLPLIAGGEPDDACDLCRRVCTNRQIASMLTAHASNAATQLRIAVIAAQVLRENHMLSRVLSKFRDTRVEIEGMDAADSLLRQLELQPDGF